MTEKEELEYLRGFVAYAAYCYFLCSDARTFYNWFRARLDKLNEDFPKELLEKYLDYAMEEERRERDGEEEISSEDNS